MAAAPPGNEAWRLAERPCHPDIDRGEITHPYPRMKGTSRCCQALRWSARPVRSAKSCGRCWTSIRSPSAPSSSSPPSAARANPSRSKGKTYTVEPIRPEAFAGVDIVLSSTPASVSREYSPIAARAGAIVIDNSQRLAHGPRRAAGGAGGQRRRPAPHPQGHRRQPQLLDDPDGRRPEAAARPGEDQARRGVHLPGVVGQGGDRPVRTRRPDGGDRPQRSRCRRRRRTPPSWPATSCRTTGRPARTATARKSGR